MNDRQLHATFETRTPYLSQIAVRMVDNLFMAGIALAVHISWGANESIGDAALHGAMSWLYVFYMYW